MFVFSGNFWFETGLFCNNPYCWAKLLDRSTLSNNIALLLLPYQTSLSNLCTKVGRRKWARWSFASLFFSFLPVVPHTYSQVTCISRLPLFATKLQKTKRRQVQLTGICISPPFEGSEAGLQKRGNRRGGYLTLVKHNTVVKTKFIHSGHYQLRSMAIHWCMCTAASPGQWQPRTWYSHLAVLRCSL